MNIRVSISNSILVIRHTLGAECFPCVVFLQEKETYGTSVIIKNQDATNCNPKTKCDKKSPGWRMISTTALMPPCRRPIPSAARALTMRMTCRCMPARHACAARVPGWGLLVVSSAASVPWRRTQAVQVIVQGQLEHRGAVDAAGTCKLLQTEEK